MILLPGTNVFMTDHDATSPELPDGSHLITCRQISDLEGLKLAWQGLRILSKFLP